MLDNQLVISDETALTSVGAVSEVLDMGLAGYGPGTPVRLKVRVQTAFTSGGSATLAIVVYSGATSGATTRTEYTLAAVAVASLVAGYSLVDIVLPAAVMRWLKVTYTVGTAAMTAGAVDAFLEPVV